MAIAALSTTRRRNGTINQLDPADRPVHDWYRFVLSYPPHLVRDYIARFGLHGKHRVLDPFCGTGTTVVECKKLGVKSAGIEAHPMSHLAGSVKVTWNLDPVALETRAQEIADRAYRTLEREGVPDDPLPVLDGLVMSSDDEAGLRRLPPDRAKLLLKDSISPRPLHKALVLLDAMRSPGHDVFSRHEEVALAKTLVFSASNLHFGPEVGLGEIRQDAPVVTNWLCNVQAMARDLRVVAARSRTQAVVHHGDARQASAFIKPQSIDAVITSPPYPNEKDYTRTTRLESVVLGLIPDLATLRQYKKTLVRSNTRSVYVTDDDDLWIKQHPSIQKIADAIEQRRLDLGKTSGFERMYPRVTKLYFGGMARHFADLRPLLRPGAMLAYVVGDQASYLQVMIRTGQLLAEIAEALGYDVVSLDLFRTRLATATREQLREEVVVLRWPGK